MWAGTISLKQPEKHDGYAQCSAEMRIEMETKHNLLIVEDEKAISNLIATTLETQGYHYEKASNGAQAMLAVTSHSPEVILLDLGLPDMDGLDIIRKVRSWSSVPIIVISARTEDQDKIEALDAGADDYLTKPFSVEELLGKASFHLPPDQLYAIRAGRDKHGFCKRRSENRFCRGGSLYGRTGAALVSHRIQASL